MAGEWVAVAAAGTVMAALAIAFFTLPGPLAAIYASDPGILAVAVPTLLVAALVLVPDGVQAVLMGALRGTADVWPAAGLYLVSFWLVMVPCGYYLGVVRGGGAPAIMQGVLVGCVLASVLLSWRFLAVTRRAIAAA